MHTKEGLLLDELHGIFLHNTISKVKGQTEDFPKIGLGTANHVERTAEAVCCALKNGCTLIDAALCYLCKQSWSCLEKAYKDKMIYRR